MALLEVKNLKKVYTTRFTQNQVQALSNVNFSVNKGEYVAIMGESGSGKTTLLNILAALDKPTSGQVLLHGKDITHISEKEIANFRREHLGFVFQDFNLLDNFKDVKEDLVYISDNGSIVYDNNGKSIYTDEINKHELKKALNDVRKGKDIYPILCGVKSAYIENNDEIFLENAKMYYEKLENVDDLMEVNKDFWYLK